MTARDWFRNPSWNDEIEASFRAKLRRARGKAQYLKLQAQTLAASNPRVALRLLEEYFATGDELFLAQAYETQAEAYLALGNLGEAIKAYHSVLAREREFPNLKTNAYVEFPFLVAVRSLSQHYASALQTIHERSADLAFPISRFKTFAAKALISAAQGDTANARESATIALSAADAEQSGFRNHPRLGLVGEEYGALRARLAQLLEA